MEQLRYRDQTYTGPGSWQACTATQRQNLIGFCRLKPGDVTDAIQQMAVQLIFSIPEPDWATWTMSVLEWEMIKTNTAWVFSPPSDRPFPSFVHNKVTYLLPEPEFADTSAIELSMAMIAYTDFAHPEESDPSGINRLLATICRPVRKDLAAFKESDDWTGDEREVFNEARMMMRAGELDGLLLAQKVVILTYFEQQLKAFLEQYEMLFGGESEPRYGDARGWIMLLKNIAKEGHFGNYDQVSRQNVHLVYAAALDDVITAEEIRDKQNNHDD